VDRTMGTCSQCGGRVTVPEAWYGTRPPIPACENCGARMEKPWGPIITTTPRVIPTRPEEGSFAMGVDWMDWRTLTQAIPPAYGQHIGEYARLALRAKETA